MSKKRIGLLGILVMLCTANMLAQTATKTTTTPAKTSTVAKPKLTEKDLLMCDKDWHVISVEEWAVITKPPGEKNKTDMLRLTQDGKFECIMFGVKKSGTWTKSGQYLYFTDDATKGKFNFKIISVEPTLMKVDHFSEEEGHSIFEYEAK